MVLGQTSQLTDVWMGSQTSLELTYSHSYSYHHGRLTKPTSLQNYPSNPSKLNKSKSVFYIHFFNIVISKTALLIFSAPCVFWLFISLCWWNLHLPNLSRHPNSDISKCVLSNLIFSNTFSTCSISPQSLVLHLPHGLQRDHTKCEAKSSFLLLKSQNYFDFYGTRYHSVNVYYCLGDYMIS